jgi:hypothetical protein
MLNKWRKTGSNRSCGQGLIDKNVASIFSERRFNRRLSLCFPTFSFKHQNLFVNQNKLEPGPCPRSIAPTSA